MLSLISYKNLTNWSVRFLLNADTMKTNYPQCSLGNLLQRNQNTTVVEDNTMYKRVTIKLYGKGVYLRDELLGKDIGTKRQYILSQGQFILSKIDARNGAFGIVPKELDGAITTADFVSFNIDTDKVLPDFLRLLVSTEHFTKMCQGQSSGTTGRQRVSLNDLLQIRIPLPSIEQQKDILNGFDLIQKKHSHILKMLKEKNEKIILELSKYIPQKTEYSKRKNCLEIIHYSKLKFWGIINEGNQYLPPNVQIVSLRDCKGHILNLFRGKSPQYDSNSTHKILNQKCIRWNFIDTSYAKSVSEDFILKKSNEDFTQPGDILINSTGDGTIGRAAVVQKDTVGLLFDSHILCLRLNECFMEANFFVEIFNSSYGQSQVQKLKSAKTTKQTELGVGNLLNFKIPLIDLQKQKRSSETIKKLREEIVALENHASQMLLNAQEFFESVIFVEQQR